MPPSVYIVRVLLLKLPYCERPEVKLQASTTCDDEQHAAALFTDLLKLMPQPQQPVPHPPLNQESGA